MLSHNVDTA